MCAQRHAAGRLLQGLEFYLVPDFGQMFHGATAAESWANFGEAVYAAMGQAFFTLSLGISAMAIFGSYIGKERSLTGEAVNIGVLDTTVALLTGLIIFPACFAFGVDPGEGPRLVFITLPSVFEQMPGSRVWGALFFLFMSFTALSTIIAVFENIISFCMDNWGWARKKAVAVNAVAVTLLSLPCALGFNVLERLFRARHRQCPGSGGLSSSPITCLPLGSLLYLVFCVSKGGWGWKNFIAEADAGQGLKFPKWARGYLTYALPALILIIFVMGYVPKFQIWLGLGA